jgi:hypothetical protein
MVRVNQAFNQVRRYGATAAYIGVEWPRVSGIPHRWLCGNNLNPDIIVQAGRKLQGYCDAIGELKKYTFIMNMNDKFNRDGNFGMSSGYSQGRSLRCLPDRKTGY